MQIDKALINDHLLFQKVSGKLPPRKLPPPPKKKKLPPENCPLWKLAPMKITPRNLSSRKFHPGKITPNEIPSPLINHTNERNNKITKFFALKKVVQYNILA